MRLIFLNLLLIGTLLTSIVVNLYITINNDVFVHSSFLSGGDVIIVEPNHTLQALLDDLQLNNRSYRDLCCGANKCYLPSHTSKNIGWLLTPAGYVEETTRVVQEPTENGWKLSKQNRNPI